MDNARRSEQARLDHLPTVDVGPFRVADLSRRDVVRTIADRAVAGIGSAPYVAFALHVGGLNARHDRAYVAAHDQAAITYADGASVVLLAKLTGARRVERAGTTDIGWEILAALATRLGRPPRLALIGGPAGLARRAGEVLADRLGVEIVLACDGYRDDWTGPLAAIANHGCDVVVVGLGVPREMCWVAEHLPALPPSLVLTCGGWFGFVVADEARAPQAIQRLGLEWVFRIAQAPRRLIGRYVRGAWSTAVLAASAAARPAKRRPTIRAHR